MRNGYKERQVSVDVQGKVKPATLVEFENMQRCSIWFNQSKRHYATTNSGLDFYGDELAKEAKENLARGNTKFAERAKKLIDKINEASPELRRKKKVRGVAGGGYLDVGAAYSGSPLCLVQRRQVVDDRAPVTIVFDCSVSAGISTETIERRGAAVLALVQKLSEKRAVDLRIIGGLKAYDRETVICSVPVQTAPLDLGRAAWALSSPSMLRRVMFSACGDFGKPVDGGNKRSETGSEEYGIQWAFSNHSWQEEKLCAWYAKELGADPEDTLLIEGRHLHSGDFQTDDDAAVWVNKTLDRFR